MSRPCVRASGTSKFKESFLQPLDNKEIITVPVFTILLEEPCERFLMCPLDADPFQTFLLAELVSHLPILDWKFAVHVVFDLLN